MPTDDATTAAPPQLSPDGHWWWDGEAWIPAAERPGAPIAVAPLPVPVAAQAAVAEPAAAQPMVFEPVDSEPVEAQPEPEPEPAAAPEPATEQPSAQSWDSGTPMPSNGIPHQPIAPQPYGGQPFVAQPYAPGYSLVQSPGKTLGIVSFVLSLAWMGGLGSVAAIVTGHMSRSKDRKAGAPQSGLALAGLIIGYVGALFTLVLLLAAVAIPVFLSQQAQGASSELGAELRSAALVQESMYADYGSYATSAAELAGGGYSGDPSIRLEVLAVDATSYCLGAVVPEVGDALYFDSTTGTVSPTPCY